MPDCESRTQRKKQQRHGERQDQVAEAAAEAHGAGVADREARGIQEIDIEVEEGFEQVGERVDRVALVAIEGDDEILGGDGEAAFVGASVAADIFADHLGAEGGGDLGGAVGGGVVHHDDLVDELGHGAEDALDALLLVEAGDDDGEGLAFIHTREQDFDAETRRRGETRKEHFY